MLVELGYASLDVQYIDGTKIEAKSNKYTFVWKGSVEKYKEKLEAKINTILSDLESSIQSDNQELNKEELPKKINGEEWKERLPELNKKLKEPAKKVAKEQKRKMKNDPFLVQNVFYNKEQDFYLCPMDQRMENIGSGKRTSSNRYESQVSYIKQKNVIIVRYEDNAISQK